MYVDFSRAWNTAAQDMFSTLYANISSEYSKHEPYLVEQLVGDGGKPPNLKCSTCAQSDAECVFTSDRKVSAIIFFLPT
jgi:hypothetical protein